MLTRHATLFLHVLAASAGIAGSAHALGEGALRHQLDLDFLLEELALEFLVLADIGRDHLADLPCAQQGPDAVVVDASVIEIGRAHV